MGRVIWTPAETQHRPRATLPGGNVRLGDRRWARRAAQDMTLPGGYRAGVWKTADGLLITAGVEPTRAWGDLLHCCMSRSNADPSWADICAVKDGFYGDRDSMMILPRDFDYVNFHPHAFHLWETPEPWGMQ